MNKYEAKKLEVDTEWNGKANVCVHCGRVPETFYVATGHDHTDYDIKWCLCRETPQTKDARIAELEAQRDELLQLVIRYRNETPLGHQPHMIAHVADEAIARVKGIKA